MNTLKLINYIDKLLNHAERMKNRVIAEAMMNQAYGAMIFYIEILLDENELEDVRYLGDLWDNKYNQKFWDAIKEGK